MTQPDRPLPAARAALLAALVAVLPGCALLADGAPAARTGVPLSAPGTFGRSETLQRLVAAMDAEAFPGGGPLALRLSYTLSLPAPVAAAPRSAPPRS